MERQGYFYEIVRWQENKRESREVEQHEDREVEQHKGREVEQHEGREVEQHEDRKVEKRKGRRRMTQKPVCDKIALCGKCKKWYKTA
ncbi:MAG: hypothetical protein K2P23_16185 [Lachnospiraceae bacterium]|nr:hypothetical protein [Lachnospiraceae bacterium]